MQDQTRIGNLFQRVGAADLRDGSHYVVLPRSRLSVTQILTDRIWSSNLYINIYRHWYVHLVPEC